MGVGVGGWVNGDGLVADRQGKVNIVVVWNILLDVLF